MKVKELMSREVRTCTPDESLSLAAQRMWDGDCGALPVVDPSHRVVGIITDRDVCMGLFLSNRPASAIRVREVMTSRVHACGPEDDLDRALDMMTRHRVRRLPVADGDGCLQAMLSINDVVLAASETSRRNGRRPTCAAVLRSLKGVCEHTAAEEPVA